MLVVHKELSQQVLPLSQGRWKQASSSTAAGEGMIAIYSRFIRLAKELARLGITVFRYHPYSRGERDGRSADFTSQSAVADACPALGYRKERAKLQRAGLLGLRFRRPVARKAAQRANADFPVPRPPVTLAKH